MKKENDVQVQRIYEKQVTIFGKALKIRRLFLISLTTTLLGIMGYLEISAISWLFISFIGICLFAFSFLLYQKSIINFKEYSIELSPSGDIFVTKMFGHCTICLGNLKVIKKDKEFYLQCSEDKNHIWKTDQKS